MTGVRQGHLLISHSTEGDENSQEVKSSHEPEFRACQTSLSPNDFMEFYVSKKYSHLFEVANDYFNTEKNIAKISNFNSMPEQKFYYLKLQASRKEVLDHHALVQ